MYVNIQVCCCACDKKSARQAEGRAVHMCMVVMKLVVIFVVFWQIIKQFTHSFLQIYVSSMNDKLKTRDCHL